MESMRIQLLTHTIRQAGFFYDEDHPMWELCTYQTSGRRLNTTSLEEVQFKDVSHYLDKDFKQIQTCHC